MLASFEENFYPEGAGAGGILPLPIAPEWVLQSPGSLPQASQAPVDLVELADSGEERGMGGPLQCPEDPKGIPASCLCILFVLAIQIYRVLVVGRRLSQIGLFVAFLPGRSEGNG